MSSSAVVLRTKPAHRVPRLPPVTAPLGPRKEKRTCEKKKRVLQFPIQGLELDGQGLNAHAKQAGFFNVRWNTGVFVPPQYPPSCVPPRAQPDRSAKRHALYAHNHPGSELKAAAFKAKTEAAKARLRAVQQKMLLRQEAILTTQNKQQRQRYRRLQAKGIMAGSSPTKATGAFLCR